VPYDPAWGKEQVAELVEIQSMEIARDLRAKSIFVKPESEMVAIIAYLQKLGVYEETHQPQTELVER